MTSFKDYCVYILGHVRPQATFLSVKEYRNNYGEVANFSVCFHANYLNAVKKSKEIIEKIIPATDVIAEAQNELLNSFRLTLNGYNPLYTCAGSYRDILDPTGKPIPGIKLHKNQDTVHINGLKIRTKTIIRPGIYPDVQSSDLTIAKRMLKSKTPLNNWRQFKLEPNRFEELIVQNMKIKG